MDQAESLAQLSVEARSKMSAVTKRLAGLQAHVARLDALGLHLTELAGLDLEEFDLRVCLRSVGRQYQFPMRSVEVTEQEGSRPVNKIEKQFDALDQLCETGSSVRCFGGASVV